MQSLGAKGKQIILLGIAFVLLLTGCQKTPQIADYYTTEDIETVLSSDEFIAEPLLEEIELDKYPAEEFLFDNHCFSFYRDMDYFLFQSARFDFTSLIIDEYPPQVVRTIENNGQKSMYIVYETDDDTRVFVFFFESDDFQFTRGYPIIMKKSLGLEAFSKLSVGDNIADVEKVDPITSLYRKGYDTLSDEMVKQLYVNGREKISSVHLLTDGIVRINYTRNSDGEYIIDEIFSADDYTIPVLGGKLCYLIYPEDYIS